MTQENFVDYCIHFVNHLPTDFGKGGTPMIIFFGGHTSRWNMPALRYLMEYNVFLFFLPSHTLVWTQSNNNKPKYWFHKCVEDSIKWLQTSGANTVAFYNTVLRHSWIDLITQEQKELMGIGSNCTTGC